MCPYEVDTNKLLGRGKFGEVFAGKHRETNTIIAAKRVLNNKKSLLETVKKEIYALEQIPPHRNTVKILRTEKIENHLWIITDFCKYGDLNKYVEKYDLQLQQKFIIMHNCTSAICHLHSLNPPIVHRDVKPENVLVADDLGAIVAKVCDFGLAKITTRLDDGTMAMGTLCGTPGFMAPELISMFEGDGSYDKSVDIYALGLLYLTILEAEKGKEMEPMRGKQYCLILYIYVFWGYK